MTNRAAPLPGFCCGETDIGGWILAKRKIAEDHEWRLAKWSHPV
jgi:hypothetical protein